MFAIINKILFIILMISIFISAIYLIKVRHENRLLFIELQHLQQQRDQLNEEWGQLQLEQSTLVQHHRIEKFARQRLNMFLPNYDQMIVIHNKE